MGCTRREHNIAVEHAGCPARIRQGQGLKGNDGRRILGRVPENEASGMELVRVAFLALGKGEYTRYLMK